MRALMKRLGLARRRPVGLRKEPPQPFVPLRPGHMLAVLGDVHGMSAAFARLLDRIRDACPMAEIICVGDLLDRGEDSAGVLRIAYALREDMTVILGNHEEMLLRFLDAPGREAGRWLRNGGLQTLASFGITPIGGTASEDEVVMLRDRLRAAIGPGTEAWLRGLPRLVVRGNVAVSHAGADPWLPIAQQPEAALTWGCADFGRRRRTDGIWVVHGHTIVAQPHLGDGVISVDTGAFAGGGLTAAIISEAGVHFFIEPS